MQRRHGYGGVAGRGEQVKARWREWLNLRRTWRWKLHRSAWSSEGQATNGKKSTNLARVCTSYPEPPTPKAGTLYSSFFPCPGTSDVIAISSRGSDILSCQSCSTWHPAALTKGGLILRVWRTHFVVSTQTRPDSVIMF